MYLLVKQGRYGWRWESRKVLVCWTYSGSRAGDHGHDSFTKSSEVFQHSLDVPEFLFLYYMMEE